MGRVTTALGSMLVHDDVSQRAPEASSKTPVKMESAVGVRRAELTIDAAWASLRRVLSLCFFAISIPR